MRTVILGAAIRVLMPIFFAFSVYIFFRGHAHPGGGFIAALITSIGLIFHMIAFGVEQTKNTYRINTFALMATGLLMAWLAAFLGLIVHGSLMEALWLDIKLPFFGKPGTPILFDMGVYFLVVGVVSRIAFTLFDENFG